MGGVERVDRLVETPVSIAPEVMREQASTQGYLFFRGLIRTASVDALGAAALAICRKFGWLEPGRGGLLGLAYDDPLFTSFQREMLVLPEFDAVRRDTAVIQVFETLFDGPVMAERGDICRAMFPNAPEFTTPPHQDASYLKHRGRVWSAWIPLDDCPLNLGPIAVVPGSHLRGLMPADMDWDLESWAAADLRRGDAVLIDSLTAHRALPNLSEDRIRLSIDCRYSPYL